MELQEIDHISVADTVIKVSQRTGQNQGQGTLQHPLAGIVSEAIYDHYDCCDSGHKTQKQDFDGRTESIKNSKGHPGILHIRYVEQAVYYRSRLSEIEVGHDGRLGNPVRYQDQDNKNNVGKSGL
jgi:hypothetical protein